MRTPASRARSRNSSTAGHASGSGVPTAGTSNGASATTDSPGSSSGDRLVASTVGCSQTSRMRPIVRAAASKQVLAVVDQEQHLAIAGRVQQRLERLEAELRGERARDGVGIVDTGEVDDARTEREATCGARRRFVGERGLAHTARPDQRDETPGLQPAVDVVELVVTPEQPHPRSRRQPTDRTVGRPGGGTAPVGTPGERARCTPTRRGSCASCRGDADLPSARS